MRKNVFVHGLVCRYLYIIITNKVNAITRKLIIPLTFLILGSGVNAQITVWPGDVNNNGIVNNIDMLYWGLAKGASGPARVDADSDWEPQLLNVLWTDQFADGINFGFADCDGNGLVDDEDLDVIKENFNEEQPIVNPDVFTDGEPAIDPILSLIPTTPEVNPAEMASLSLSLGDTANPIDEFFGIAFTINYEPEYVNDDDDDDGGFEILFTQPNNWIDQDPPNHARVETMVMPGSGEAQVAVFRRNPGVNSGGGEFGVLNIVMVDIVLLSDEQTPIFVDKIKMINPGLEETLVAPSETEITVLGDSTTATLEQLHEQHINLYPNPAKDLIRIELKDNTNEIKKIELYNTLGQTLYSNENIPDKQKSQLLLSHYRPGIYLLRIDTAKGVFTKLFTR